MKRIVGLSLVCTMAFVALVGMPSAHAESLYVLPYAAKTKGNDVDFETLLITLSIDGGGQSVRVSPGQRITVYATLRIYSSGGPGIVKQAFFIASWTPYWPPPSGYYFPMYEGNPGYSPGITAERSFQLSAPSSSGTYYLWFCGEAQYGMNQAVNQYRNPLSLPAHAQIDVVPSEGESYPSLTLFDPVVSGRMVAINGVTTPGRAGTSIVRISWDWGDGVIEDHWFPNSHGYSRSGTFHIKVASYQSDGLRSERTVTVTV